MVKSSFVGKDIWSYHTKPEVSLVWFALWFTIIFSIAVVVLLQYNSNSVISLVLAIMVFIFVIIAIGTANTTVLINRRDATVKKSRKILFFSKDRIYPLGDFHAIRLLKKVAPIEEGYRTIFYSLVLQGKKSFLEILSTGDEDDGESLKRELSTFLQVPSE